MTEIPMDGSNSPEQPLQPAPIEPASGEAGEQAEQPRPEDDQPLAEAKPIPVEPQMPLQTELPQPEEPQLLQEPSPEIQAKIVELRDMADDPTRTAAEIRSLANELNISQPDLLKLLPIDHPAVKELAERGDLFDNKTPLAEEEPPEDASEEVKEDFGEAQKDVEKAEQKLKNLKNLEGKTELSEDDKKVLDDAENFLTKREKVGKALKEAGKGLFIAMLVFALLQFYVLKLHTNKGKK